MWPPIGNTADEPASRYNELLRGMNGHEPLPRRQRRWLAQALRSSGARLMTLADKLEPLPEPSRASHAPV
jgi:hypothetical protein